MNAGRLLRDTGHDNPTLRAAIHPVDPESINVWPASRWLRKLWRPGIKGVTHWTWVFVDPDFMRGDPERLARLVIHELVHVRQYLESGYFRFMSRYVIEYLKGRAAGKTARQAYLDITAETEAREVTARTIAAR